jgi:hypothetical protein
MFEPVSASERQPLVCKCRQCQARYTPKEFQSKYYCENCMQPVAPGCMHGVSLLTPCSHCHTLYGHPHMRLTRAVKKDLKKISQARMRAIR